MTTSRGKMICRYDVKSTLELSNRPKTVMDGEGDEPIVKSAAYLNISSFVRDWHKTEYPLPHLSNASRNMGRLWVLL